MSVEFDRITLKGQQKIVTNQCIINSMFEKPFEFEYNIPQVHITLFNG